MPKTDANFDPALYAPVAERIRLFYERHPGGRIISELVSRTSADVVFKALVYRESTDQHAAATGWSAEREGDGDINQVACLENAETSAIGRALANLGFTAARERPSAEEMAKAERARRSSQPAPSAQAVKRPAIHESMADPYGLSSTSLQRKANQVLDLLHLIDAAGYCGLRSGRAARWRAAIEHDHHDVAALTKWEKRLQQWITRSD
jgi:hypothetical protein